MTRDDSSRLLGDILILNSDKFAVSARTVVWGYSNIANCIDIIKASDAVILICLN